MSDAEFLLTLYPALSPAERADVDRQFAHHPAYAPARRLAALLDVAQADPKDDLARQAVERRMGLRPAMDSGDGAEVALVEAWLDRYEDEGADPVERFERLTGRALAGPDTAAGPKESRRVQPRTAPPRTAPPRTAPRWRRRATAMAGLLLIGYGGLWVVSASSATPRQQVADLESLEVDASMALAESPAPPAAVELRATLQRVRDARRSTLGLFPHYDGDALDAAALDLDGLAALAEASSWVSQEARLSLGRVYLYRQRDLDAARVLGGLVHEGSYRAPVARRLLDYVRARD